MPIPLVQILLEARIDNLNKSRYKAEKTGEIDVYVKDEYYGMKAITSAISALFGGDKKDGSKGVKNIRDRD